MVLHTFGFTVGQQSLFSGESEQYAPCNVLLSPLDETRADKVCSRKKLFFLTFFVIYIVQTILEAMFSTCLVLVLQGGRPS